MAFNPPSIMNANPNTEEQKLPLDEVASILNGSGNNANNIDITDPNSPLYGMDVNEAITNPADNINTADKNSPLYGMEEIQLPETKAENVSKPAQAQPANTLWDTVNHYLGLGAEVPLKATAAFADMPTAVYNGLTWIDNNLPSFTGNRPQQQYLPYEASNLVDKYINAVEAPKPETPAQNLGVNLATSLAGGEIGATPRLANALSSVLSTGANYLGLPEPVSVALGIGGGIAGGTLKNARGSESAAPELIIKSLKNDNLSLDQLDALVKNGTSSVLQASNSPSLRNLAEGAAQLPAGRNIAQQYFSEQTGKSINELNKSISDYVSPDTDYYKTIQDITDAGQLKAAPLYETAQKQPIENSDVINSLMSRPSVKLAANKAENLAAEQGIDLSQFSNAQEKPTIYYDYIKRGLDDIINDYRDPVTGKLNLDNQARAILNTKSQLVDELKQQNPDYSKALSTSSDYLSNVEAMQMGRDSLKNNIDPEQVATHFKSLSEPEKQAYVAGQAQALRDNLNNNKGINEENPSTNPVRSLFYSPNIRAKLQATLSPEDFSNLQNTMQTQDTLFKLKNQILGNSSTASRQEAKNYFISPQASFVQDIAANGVSGVGINKINNWLTNMFPKVNSDTVRQVSNILYATDPKEQLDNLQLLRDTAEKNPAGIHIYRNLMSAIKQAAISQVSNTPISNALNNQLLNQGVK